MSNLSDMLSTIGRWLPSNPRRRQHSSDVPVVINITPSSNESVIVLQSTDFDSNGNLWKQTHVDVPMLVAVMRDTCGEMCQRLKERLAGVHAQCAGVVQAGVYEIGDSTALQQGMFFDPGMDISIHVYTSSTGWSNRMPASIGILPTVNELTLFAISHISVLNEDVGRAQMTEAEDAPHKNALTMVDGVYVLTFDDFVDGNLIRSEHRRLPMLVVFSRQSCYHCVTLKAVLGDVAKQVTTKFLIGELDTTPFIMQAAQEFGIERFPSLRVFYPSTNSWSATTIDVYPRTVRAIVSALESYEI